MPNPYDSSIKELFERGPADWLALAGIVPRGPIHAINADLSSISAEADRVLLVEEDPRWIINFEIQSSYDATLPRRLFRYNSLLDLKFGLPVESVAILLRREADGPEINGMLTRARPDGLTRVSMSYGIIRVWTLPWEALLDGGLATLPLALIADAPQSKLDFIARRVDDRLRAEADPAEAQLLRTATSLLLGLRYPRSEIVKMFGSGEWVKDSSFFHMVYEMAREKAISEGMTEGIAKGMTEGIAKGMTEGIAKGMTEGIARGRAEGRVEGIQEGLEAGRALGQVGTIREMLLRLGTRRLGEPDDATKARIADSTDIARLERMVERVIEAGSWDEILSG